LSAAPRQQKGLAYDFFRFVSRPHDAPGEAGEAHWNEEAKALIAGLILYIAAEQPLKSRTLATLRDYLTAAPEVFSAHLTHMQGINAMGGLVARAANRQLGKSANLMQQ
jgi:type IV secretion system protein VirD4